MKGFFESQIHDFKQVVRKIGEFVKPTAQWLVGKLGAARLASGSRDADGFGILVYHRVAPNARGVRTPSFNVRPERFREQIKGLKKIGFQSWPLGRLLEYQHTGNAVPPKTFVITFDDGFESVYRYAWPVLVELEMPITLLVNPDFLDSPNPFPFDTWGIRHQKMVPPDTYRPLTRAQCIEMKRGGLVELGTHTCSHGDFRGRATALKADLMVCQAKLRHWFEIEDVPFALPYGKSRLGYADKHLLQAARAAGATCALTTDGHIVGPQDDPYGWGRFNAYDFDSAKTLAAKCSGCCDWAYRLQDWIPKRL